MADARLIRYPGDIDDAWLSGVLGRDVQITSVRRIGTGQMSFTNRVSFTGADLGITSVIVKQASDDDKSRASGISMRVYYREVAFYDQLASRIVGPVPTCHLAVYDPADGWFTLVLEDVAGVVVGDQVGGGTIEQAHLAMRGLAQVHAPVFDDASVGAMDFLNGADPLGDGLLASLARGFLERYADRIDPAHAELCRGFVPVNDAWRADRRGPLGLVHGDYRLDNLLFGADSCTVVDWQTVGWGAAMADAAYFLGSSLSTRQRREHEHSLVRAYHDELVGLGVASLDWDLCWTEYRRQTFHGMVMPIVASMVVPRSDRGDGMFLTWFARACRQILDLDSVALLPSTPPATGTRPAAPQPLPADDSGRHEPGPEPMWNESWYFDAVNTAGDVGVYLRLGRLPNHGSSVYTLAVVGPGRPAVILVDTAAPLPDTDDDVQAVHTDSLRAEQQCLEPLTTFRVTAEGRARSHVDESAPLREEEGRPVQVSLDLTWHTVGTPYLWRRSTRYEIPCHVSGTVRVGDEVIAIDGPGQRDHSWGVRDWWSGDWVWSAFHLSDGTHTHSVTVPQAPGFAVGYAQRGGEMTEWASGSSSETATASGLIAATRITTEPGGLTLDVEPLAFGALRMTSPDGRVTHFPRAMARVTSNDGRTGLGWIEWNRNQS